MHVTELAFTKGHGTENDFILIPDHEGALDLTADLVRKLADRHAGVGADGVIRVVRSAHSGEPAIAALSEQAEWFMDYRNADGSLAEMCGNGTRVFAAYLRREGLETATEFAIATRTGVKAVRVEGDTYAVDLGAWRFVEQEKAIQDGHDALVHVPGHDPLSAVSVDLGNPHTVAALPPAIELDKLDLSVIPAVNPDPEHGTNVEFVRPLGPGHIGMRVHERGVGETRSCGTGACAAALATSLWATGAVEPGEPWVVDVPGGRLRVTPLPGQRVELAGPAVLVADGDFPL